MYEKAFRRATRNEICVYVGCTLASVVGRRISKSHVSQMLLGELHEIAVIKQNPGHAQTRNTKDCSDEPCLYSIRFFEADGRGENNTVALESSCGEPRLCVRDV